MNKSGKIEIMHVVHSLQTGGMENGVVNLINKMDHEQFCHSICCITSSGEMEKRIKRNDVKIFEMKKKEGHDFSLPLRMASIFRREKVDIVHTRNWGAIDGIIGAKLGGISIVIHGEHGRDMSDSKGINRKRNFVRKGLSFFVDRYITVSKDLREWLTTSVGIDNKKVQSIYNGVDTIKFAPDKADSIREEHDINKRDIVFGIAGRLDPVKDQQLLIKAFSQLAQKYNNVSLIIIGDGPCRKDLEKLTCDSGIKRNVHFLGMRKDVPELLGLMDIFVLPSIIEGMSNTVLESMASGLPVIATNVGGNPELIKDGETGCLFPVGNIKALKKLMEQYILKPETIKQHGTAARERAVKEFSLDRMVSRYDALYANLATVKNITVKDREPV